VWNGKTVKNQIIAVHAPDQEIHSRYRVEDLRNLERGIFESGGLGHGKRHYQHSNIQRESSKHETGFGSP